MITIISPPWPTKAGCGSSPLFEAHGLKDYWEQLKIEDEGTMRRRTTRYGEFHTIRTTRGRSLGRLVRDELETVLRAEAPLRELAFVNWALDSPDAISPPTARYLDALVEDNHITWH